jgi:endo-1,4-beta-xylanase
MPCLLANKHPVTRTTWLLDGVFRGRRRGLNVVVGLAAVLLLVQATGGQPGAAQSLRQEADRLGRLVGAAVDPSRFSEASYASTLAREFNMVEPENAMKWAAIRPDQQTFNFVPGDQVVAFAEAHQMKVRGHNLLWGMWNPDWLAKGNFTPEQLSQLLHDHITTVMKHYAGKVFAWDVVNEAFQGDGKLQDSIWYNHPGIGLAGKGTAYIEQAFRWARAADPHALLFYNDWGAEGVNAQSDAIYAMVKEFKRRGVPIDGVGLQTHIFSLNPPALASLSDNMARLVALGVQVQITEMDVGLHMSRLGEPTDPVDLLTQARIYRQVAEACARQPGCTAFQTWGVTDRYTWIPGAYNGMKGVPLLFDRDYAPKSAYQAALDAFHYTPTPAGPATRAPVPAGGS